MGGTAEASAGCRRRGPGGRDAEQGCTLPRGERVAEPVTAPSGESMTAFAQRSFQIQGGEAAPRRARNHVLTHLGSRATSVEASDAALLVSELVTNSVLHAQIGADQTLSLELTTLENHLRIEVVDAGSTLRPRLLPPNLERPGGLGLRLVDRLSSTWGVQREASGATRVWCDLPLAHI